MADELMILVDGELVPAPDSFAAEQAAIAADVRRLSTPASISDRQFFQQLAIDGVISEAEALAAVKTGDIPEALTAMLDGLDAAARFSAEMLLSGATEFRRDHPLTAAIGAARGLTAEQIDDLFRAAAAL